MRGERGLEVLQGSTSIKYSLVVLTLHNNYKIPWLYDFLSSSSLRGRETFTVYTVIHAAKDDKLDHLLGIFATGTQTSKEVSE